MSIKRLSAILVIAMSAGVASANIPMKNGVPFLPDEVLLGKGMPYFHKTSQKNSPALERREPTQPEQSIIARANKLVADTDIKMMVMVDGGKIVNANYKAPANETSTFMSASMVKSVTAMSAGVAICDGKLTLNTKVKDVVGELANNDIGEATLKDLLTMRSGTTSPQPGGLSETTSEMQARFAGRMTLIEHIKTRAGNTKTKTFGGKHQPGEVFEYKGQDPLVTAMMISSAYGSSDGTGFAKWQENNLFSKIKTGDTVIVGQDTRGYADSGSNIRMTANDWIRYGVFVQQSRKETGCYGDFTRAATSTQVKNTKDQVPYFGGFGYNFWTENEYAPDTYSTVGYGGQTIIWSTKTDKFIVVFSNTGQGKEVSRIAKEWFALN